MSNTWCSLSTSTSNRSRSYGDSAAPFVSHWGSDKRHFVDVRGVLQQFGGLAKILSLANGVQDINTSVTVGKTTVVVGGYVEVVGMTNIEQLVLHPMLIINDKMSLNQFIVGHGMQVASSFEFRKVERSIAEKHATVGVACFGHQFSENIGKLVLNADGKNTGHAVTRTSVLIAFVKYVLSNATTCLKLPLPMQH